MDQAHVGTVSTVSPLVVFMDGAATSSSAYHLADYTPVANDRVAVISYRDSLLVLGTTA